MTIKTRYGPFRTYEIPGPSNSSPKYVSKETAAIFRKITCEVTQLVWWSDVMKEWKCQITIAFRNAKKQTGKRPIDLPCTYLILARIHDKGGGLPRIITKAIDAKWPECLNVNYRPADYEIYLENVKADLNQKELLKPVDLVNGNEHKVIKRKKGRPRKINPKEADRRSELVEGWKGAKKAKISRLDFTENEGITVEYLKVCMDWMRKKKQAK